MYPGRMRKSLGGRERTGSEAPARCNRSLHPTDHLNGIWAEGTDRAGPSAGAARRAFSAAGCHRPGPGPGPSTCPGNGVPSGNPSTASAPRPPAALPAEPQGRAGIPEPAPPAAPCSPAGAQPSPRPEPAGPALVGEAVPAVEQLLRREPVVRHVGRAAADQVVGHGRERARPEKHAAVRWRQGRANRHPRLSSVRPVRRDVRTRRAGGAGTPLGGTAHAQSTDSRTD